MLHVEVEEKNPEQPRPLRGNFTAIYRAAIKPFCFHPKNKTTL